MAKKGVVNEITYPDMNSGLEEQAPVGGKKSELPKYNDFQKKQMEKIRQNYIDAGYTNKPGDVYFYSPEGVKTGVRYTGEFDTIPGDYQDVVAKAKQNRRQTEQQQGLNGGVNNLKETNNGGETAGSTVAQNAQNATQNQNGTSVSNGNTNTRKYDGTDGNGNITVGPQNANLNYYQYGDDSNPNQQGQKGGMNAKYTGEGVSNSYIEYNPDITLADLDPNYLYGENARQQNRKEAGYIARRNDMIASALYNEGKVSREDVANFLSQQNEWMNSTEADRLNTIESVWKRLGQIKPEEYQPDLSKAEDIVKDTSGKIYGKTTAEEGNPKQGIDTLSDDNSVFKKMQEKQVKDVQDFVSQDYRNIATCIVEGTPYWSEQTWRDAQKYYPDFISLVNEEVKRQRTQQNVTAIASGGEMTTSAANGQSSANTEIANFGASNATGTKSSVEITKDVHNALAQNQTANEASETMASIEEDMAILKNRLKNLRAEANSKFKGDAPDYLVNAYMNNKAQEIQNQMQILEDRYNAAYTRYKTEIAQTQWQQEFDLKKKQLEMDEKEFELKKWATEQGVEIDWYKAKGTTSTSNSGRELPVTTKTRDEIGGIVDNLVDMVNNGEAGNAQCATGIQRYYFPELGISIGGLSTFEAKKGLINTDKYYVPKKGDLVIIDSGAKLEDGTNAGHIGIVVSVDGDTLTYLDWNGDGKETAKVRTTSINNKKIAGYYDVTKGQSSTYSSGKWTDEDYSNFESFLDTDKETRMNKTDKEAMAAEYGTDLEGMRILATEALAARNSTEDITVNTTDKGTVSINEEGRTVITPTDGGEPIVYAYGVTANDKRINQPGFDPTLGYNTYNKDFYNEVNKNPDESKYTKQQIEEARNFADAQAKGKDGYDDEARGVDQEFGFIIDKKDAYQRIYDAMHSGKTITPNQKKQFEEELKLDPSNANAWTKVTQEVDAYRIWTDEVLEDEANELSKLIRATEYLIMQDATKYQRKLAINDEGSTGRQAFGEAESWANAYKYIVDAETLEKLIDTKGRGGTLTPVSDKDISMIKNAATDIKYDDDSDTFKEKVTDFYIKLRNSIGKDISREEVYDMRNQEGAFPRLNYGANGDFSNYLIIDHAHKTGVFGGWNYGNRRNGSQGNEEEVIESTNTIGGKKISARNNTGGTTGSSSSAGTDAMDDINNVING